jgi:hypothetical protein
MTKPKKFLLLSKDNPDREEKARHFVRQMQIRQGIYPKHRRPKDRSLEIGIGFLVSAFLIWYVFWGG